MSIGAAGVTVNFGVTLPRGGMIVPPGTRRMVATRGVRVAEVAAERRDDDLHVGRAAPRPRGAGGAV